MWPFRTAFCPVRFGIDQTLPSRRDVMRLFGMMSFVPSTRCHFGPPAHPAGDSEAMGSAVHVLAHGVLPGGCALVAHDFFGADLTAACAREPTGRRPLGAQVQSTSAPGLGLTPATSAPGPGSPQPHLRRDWPAPVWAAPGLGLTPPTPAPGLGSSRPHLRRDWAHPAHICAGTGLTPPTSAPGLARACLGCADSATRRSAAQRARAQIVYWARRAGGRVLNVGSIRAAAALLEASQKPSLPHHDGRYAHHGLVASTPSWPSATNGDADGACIVAH